MSDKQSVMTAGERKAWHVLCAETADGLHQFDYWLMVAATQ